MTTLILKHLIIQDEDILLACFTKLIKFVSYKDQDKVVILQLIQKRILNRIKPNELEAIGIPYNIAQIDEEILANRLEMFRGNANNKAGNIKYFEEKNKKGDDVQRLEIEQNIGDISEIPLNFDEKNFYDSLDEGEIRHLSFTHDRQTSLNTNNRKPKQEKGEIVEIPPSPLFRFKGDK